MTGGKLETVVPFLNWDKKSDSWGKRGLLVIILCTWKQWKCGFKKEFYISFYPFLRAFIFTQQYSCRWRRDMKENWFWWKKERIYFNLCVIAKNGFSFSRSQLKSKHWRDENIAKKDADAKNAFVVVWRILEKRNRIANNNNRRLWCYASYKPHGVLS